MSSLWYMYHSFGSCLPSALCAKPSSRCLDLPVNRTVKNPACVCRGEGSGQAIGMKQHSKLFTELMSAVDKTAQALGSHRE